MAVLGLRFCARAFSSCGKWGGHSSSRCAGLSLSRPLLLWSTGSRRAGSVVVAHGPNCSAACGIFPDQGSNPCPLHWQADSQPLRHQGSPFFLFLKGVSVLMDFLYLPGSCSRLLIWAILTIQMSLQLLLLIRSHIQCYPWSVGFPQGAKDTGVLSPRWQ